MIAFSQMAHRVLLIVLLNLTALIAFSQCENVGFESASFMGWVGYTGHIDTDGIDTPYEGIQDGRHTIMSGEGLDPYACQDITVVAPDGGE